MKTNTNSCKQLTKGVSKIEPSNFKVVLMLLMLINIAKFSNLPMDTCSLKHDAPSCNLTGPLVACLNGGLMTITTTIDFSSANPMLVYTFACKYFRCRHCGYKLRKL